MRAPYEIIQTYLKSYSLGLQLSFLTILIVCTIFRVWSTLSNQEMYKKFAENIFIVLIDTNDIMGTVNIISIFYSYLFHLRLFFNHISWLIVDIEIYTQPPKHYSQSEHHSCFLHFFF
jgi:hypothetical protein